MNPANSDDGRGPEFDIDVLMLSSDSWLTGLNTTIFIHRIIPKGIFGTPTRSQHGLAEIIRAGAHKLFSGKDEK